MLDLLIRSAEVVDGSGAEPFVADVAVDHGRIVSVGRLGRPLARHEIDADGLVVAPGFIDMHTHSDFSILQNPRAESSVYQGVTTEVIGNCGYSAAPVNRVTLGRMQAYTRSLGPDLPWTWNTFAEYLTHVRQSGTAINLIPLVGHGAVRIAVMGFSDRRSDQPEMEAMRALVARAMTEGAWGLSTGLIYPPGVFADKDEIADLAGVAARCGGIYASHMRGEGETLLSAVDEAIEIGERAGARVQISHFKAAGAANWGKVAHAADRIEAGRARGLAVTSDFYPYLAGSTFLSMVLPPWAHEGGGPELLARLRQPGVRALLRHDMERGIPGWQNFFQLAGGWDRVLISSVGPRLSRAAQGKTVAELACREHKDAFDTVCDLILAANGEVMALIFMMSEDDVRWLMRFPHAAIGSDSLTCTPKGAMGRSNVHPRYYGTFARVLGHYVRDENVLSLPEAVRKMTGLPASIMGLKDRGLLREGLVADLALFDPDRVADRATYADPHVFAEGVEWVLVNGHLAMEKGEHTGLLAGEVLTRENSGIRSL